MYHECDTLEQAAAAQVKRQEARLNARRQQQALATEISRYRELTTLEDSLADLPAFPIHCLPTPLQTFAHKVAVSLQVQPDAVAMQLLAMYAIAARDVFAVNPGGNLTGLIQPALNLFLLTVMPTGSGKSVIVSVLRRPFDQYVQTYNTAHRTEIEMSRHKLDFYDKAIAQLKKEKDTEKIDDALAAIEKLEEQKAAVPVRHYLEPFATDITSQELMNAMGRHNGVMAIVATEAGMIENMAGRYDRNGHLDLDIFLAGYSNEPFSKMRATAGSCHLPRTCLAFDLLIQPDVLRDFMTKAFIRRGLTARFLYQVLPVRPSKSLAATAPLTEADQQPYWESIQNLLAIPRDQTAVELVLSDGARQVLCHYHDKVLQPRLEEDLADVVEAASRMIGNTLRLAGVLHLMAKGQQAVVDAVIPVATVNQAIALTDYFLLHARAAHSPLFREAYDTGRQYVLAKFDQSARRDRLGVKTLAWSALRRQCKGRYKTADALKPVVDALVHSGVLRREHTPTAPGGRSVEYLRLNPLADPHFGAGKGDLPVTPA